MKRGPDRSTLRIYRSVGCYLVWDPRHIYTLRCTHRILGSLIGPAAGKNRQAAESSPPLALLFEEALLAAEQGFAQVVDGRLPATAATTSAGYSAGSIPNSGPATDASSHPSIGNCTADGTCRKRTADGSSRGVDGAALTSQSLGVPNLDRTLKGFRPVAVADSRLAQQDLPPLSAQQLQEEEPGAAPAQSRAPQSQHCSPHADHGQ